MNIYSRKTRPSHGARKARLALVAAAIAGGLSQAAFGQDEDDEVFELSPFVINAEDSSGYQATSTLAGTRIKTNLKDLGSAISVVTEEFMEDTGSTDLESVLSYLTNTEVGGMQGNFSGTVTTDFVPNQDEARSNPQSTARVRGLFRPNYTRGYFSTNIPIDSYNTGAITINRGANSLLFGLGSASGVIDTGLKGPKMARDSNKFSVRTDEHGSLRGTFDINRVIIPERLAVRLAGVHSDTQYRQNPAFDKTQRFTGSFQSILFKNENSSFLGRTTLRGNFEVGNTKRTPPDAIAPIVAYESFFLPPPDTRQYTNQDYTIGLGYDNLIAGWTKWQTTDTRPILLDTPGTNLPKTPSVLQSAAAPSLDAFYQPGAWASLYSNNTPNEYQIRWNETVATNFNTAHFFNDIAIAVNGYDIPDRAGTGLIDGFHGRIPLPGGPWGTHVNTRLYVEGPQGVGFKGSSLQDTNVFDYKNNLITGDLQRIDRDFDAQTLTLEQGFHDGKGGIELTLDQQYWSQAANQPFGGGGRNLPIYIDGTEYLANGQPNPNVGRALMITRGLTDQTRTIKRDNSRVTAFYELDFADHSDRLGRWLGRHSFTGLLQEEETSSQNVNYGTYWVGNDFHYNAALNNSTNDNVATGAGVVALAYVSDDNRGKEMDQMRLTPLSNDSIPQDGDSYRVFYFDRRDQANLKEGTVTATRLRSGGGASRVNVASEAVAWQSYLFDGNIVGLVGWRTDEVDTYGRQSTNIRALNNEWSLDNLALEELPGTERGSTTTWSVVGHLPQRFVDNLGFITGVSAHYGVGENFQAIEQRNNIFGEPFDNPNGQTTEYGISLQIADKWTVKINKYETAAAASTANSTGLEGLSWITNFLNNWQQGINDPVTFPFDSDGIGPKSARDAGYTSYQQVIDSMLAAIPEPTRSLWDYQYNVEAETWRREGTIDNLREVSDVIAEGMEIELVGNPTKNWRIIANVAQTETTNSNTADALFEFNTQMIANMKADGRLYNPVLRQSVDSAVGWVERWTQDVVTRLSGVRAKDGTVSQEQREWRANLVNNYTFREGRFKGLNIGGAIRWQDTIATGYEVLIDEFGNQIPDVNNPFIGDSEMNGDLWIGYKRKLGDRVDWKIQLNLRNLVGDQDDIVSITNPDGQDVQFRLAPERTWFLTNTFEF